MVRPVIGITVSKYNASASDGALQTPRLAAPVDYADAVIAVGGAPVLLPRSADAEVVAAAMARVDGLLLSGGGDVSALALGVDPHPALSGVDHVRDKMEYAAIAIALERGIPIFGICRGMQVLAAACGGALIPDIPSCVKGAMQHASRHVEPWPSHFIEIERGTLAERLMGGPRVAVNSTHHQAVADPGSGMRITARAGDGVAEAMEAEDGRPVLAVQSHPERHFRELPECAALFRWLVGEAAARSGGK